MKRMTTAEALRVIKRSVGDLHKIKAIRNKITIELYLAVYWWVTGIERDQQVHRKTAIERLSRSLKLGFQRVSSWFYCGKMVFEKKIPSSANAAAVRMVYNWRSYLSPRHLDLLVYDIKNGASTEKIRSKMAGFKEIQVERARRSAGKFSGKTGLTKSQITLSLIASKILAEKSFSKEVVIEMRDAYTGQVLASAGSFKMKKAQ